MELGPHELSRFLLFLFRAVAEIEPSEFQSHVLDHLCEILPFDSALWGSGHYTSAGGVPHQIHLYRQPAEMMENYDRVKQHDTFAAELQTNKGKTVNCTPTGPEWASRLHPAVIEHTRRFGMNHTLGTVIADPVLGLFTAVSLYRADIERPFDESQRLFKEWLTPHLSASWTANRLAFLGRAGRRIEAQRRLICDVKGWIHTVGPGALEMVHAEWPSWSGPRLPDEWLGLLGRKSARWKGRKLVLRSEALNEFRLLYLRPVSAIDGLTPRELEVARRFGEGSGYREIAKGLRLSPATVRNYLQAIYAKLDVGNKVELARALRVLDD